MCGIYKAWIKPQLSVCILTLVGPHGGQTIQLRMAGRQVPDPTEDSLRSLLAPGMSKSREERLDRLWKTFESDQLDPIYGVREISRGRLKIGSLDVFFRRSHARIGKNEYPLTQGLLELLFKRIPNEEVISKSDLQHYQQILNESNVHRLHNRSTGKLRATSTAKWNLISNLLDDFHLNSNEEQSPSELSLIHI